MIYIFVPLKRALNNLETNVCFLEIDDKYEDLKISCDWCSICNGIVETAKQNIIKNPRIIKLIDFRKLQVLDKLFDFVLIDRTEKLINKKTEEWCYNTFEKLYMIILKS